ncbi:uncharacterized membrane protein (DUF485 family) [Alicyclobacillus tengchongensis]|uniref:Uncharacterized membrane protein (DUF485 family) n=1 Tax=Alicyclobacillus tolerans TaxID=90970 RepID=A0ABT9LZ87_9BACL|nr:uncharacterized membrane protein (DUF485 family) [Alicyclobacillus tengchongensis]
MKISFKVTNNRKGRRISRYIVMIALLMQFNYIMLVTNEYKDLQHELLGIFITGIWILVNVLIIAIVVKIIYVRRRE